MTRALPSDDDSGLTGGRSRSVIMALGHTMSSRAIADVVNKRHDNVKRTIETLSEKGVIQPPQIEEVKNHLGQTVQEYFNMSKKPETPLQPGVTASGVPFSQLDTTGYDFGGSQSAEAIAASLARINAMPLTPEMLAGGDDDESCEDEEE